MFVALDDFIRGLELLIVLVLNAERFPDVVDDLLIRRRIVAAWRLVARKIRLLPIRVHVAASNRRRDPGIFLQRLCEFDAAGARR